MIPHINISGMPGALKSSTARVLVARYPLPYHLWICRETTREMRPGEVQGQEYHFLTQAEYDRKFEKGMLLPWPEASGHKDYPDGRIYFRGTPHFNFWPHENRFTKFKISVFGARVSPLIKQVIGEDITNIFLTGSDEILLGRVRSRPGSASWRDEEHYRRTIALYRATNLESQFDYIISTDFRTPEEVADQIERIAGLVRLQQSTTATP